MEIYGNRSGKSGVRGYVCGPDFITLWFAGERRGYRYTHADAGRANVETMKRLARAGRGLSTFVSRHRDELSFTRD